MSDDDEWIKVAMVEDSLVAELLINLKEIKPPLSPPSPPEQTLSFEWKVRQRRSKAGVVVHKIKHTSTSSPTTPLSWCGATSISGGGGQGGGGSGCTANMRGFEVEESSQLSMPPSAPKISDMEMERSKVSGSCEVSNTKKYRKKKTLAELKEEELSLERERRQLKREIESIRDNLVRERTRNANFKRMKQQLASFKPISMTLPSVTIHQSSQNGCQDRKMETGAGKFELPDLNLSLEENPCGLL